MENAAARQTRTKAIVRSLKKSYPDARLALDFNTPLQLLIALILAAQCTDERVNRVTPLLFRKYRSARDWAEADRRVLEQEIHSTGFFRQKAAAIQKCTAELAERFNGAVPRKLGDLLSLPGVGRKTANILRGNAFGEPAIGVDTHVGRLAFRLGLTEWTDPDKIEADLTAVVPRKDQVRFCWLLQCHGRAICAARAPKCQACVVEALCPKCGVAGLAGPARRAGPTGLPKRGKAAGRQAR
jgi:endonuclease III